MIQGADDGGFTMKDGAHYYLTANVPAIFEARFAVTSADATCSWFVGLGPEAPTIDLMFEAGGQTFSPVSWIGVHAVDTTGLTARAGAYNTSVLAAMGTTTITTATMITFSITWDGVTLRSYANGVFMGSTTDAPTGVALQPNFGQECGGTAMSIEYDYMLFYQKTPRSGARY